MLQYLRRLWRLKRLKGLQRLNAWGEGVGKAGVVEEDEVEEEAECMG